MDSDQKWHGNQDPLQQLTVCRQPEFFMTYPFARIDICLPYNPGVVMTQSTTKFIVDKFKISHNIVTTIIIPFMGTTTDWLPNMKDCSLFSAQQWWNLQCTDNYVNQQSLSLDQFSVRFYFPICTSNYLHLL